MLTYRSADSVALPVVSCREALSVYERTTSVLKVTVELELAVDNFHPWLHSGVGRTCLVTQRALKVLGLGKGSSVIW